MPELSITPDAKAEELKDVLRKRGVEILPEDEDRIGEYAFAFCKRIEALNTIESEGDIVILANGLNVVNPRYQIVKHCEKTMRDIGRLFGISPAGRGATGKSKKQGASDLMEWITANGK